MKQLNIESTKTMNKLVGMLEDGYVKIDNTDGAFMSVNVEVIFEDEKFKVISLAHYFLQNGDLMADPEMCFLYNKIQGVYFPIYFKQDNIGVEEESVEIRDGEILRVNLSMQSEHSRFANLWLRNIKHQQCL
jgi:hypothetical protein